MQKKQRKNPKIPIISSDIHPTKIPVYLGAPNLEGRHLSWRFSSADVDGPFSCGQFNHDDFIQFWGRMRTFERMNVSQLRDAESFHGVLCTNISRKAKTRLEEIKKDDLEIIYGFRITGECRLWCMRHENILAVLWWDRKHEVYPVGKKHT